MRHSFHAERLDSNRIRGRDGAHDARHRRLLPRRRRDPEEEGASAASECDGGRGEELEPVGPRPELTEETPEYAEMSEFEVVGEAAAE